MMLKKFLNIFLFISLAFLFEQFAQIIALNGGKKDETPPKLLEAIPKLNSTNFNSELIVLNFDEFVQLKNLNNQLSICPRLKTDLELYASGKKVEIRLKKEDLKPNTTYRISVGNAIADMTESNSIPDFDYVFSTGETIDTLKVDGTISDAFTNENLPGILIGLYSNIERGDSLPYFEKADYYTRSLDNGSFQLKNLPQGTYKLFGIADQNKNSTYDGETEKIAFLKSNLKLSSDTNINLSLFQEEPAKVFVKKSIFTPFGSVQIILNKASIVHVRPLLPTNEPRISQINKALLKDTLTVFYKDIQDTLSMILDYKLTNVSDTLKLPIPTKKPSAKKFRNIQVNTSMNQLNINSPFVLRFSNWMDTSIYTFSGIRLLTKEDSLIKSTAVKGHWKDITTFELDFPFQEAMRYTIKIDTNTFFDINRIPNDSIKFDFTVHQKSDYGKVRLNLLLNKKQSYVIQLLNEQNKIVKETSLQLSLSSSNATSIDFKDILPGTYIVKVIFDDNKNQKWDSGNLIPQQLPERVLINSKQLKILSDWEIEEVITIKD